MEKDKLFPIIIPRRYNNQNQWIGPIRFLKHPELAITWVHMHESSMGYLTHYEANCYLDAGINYHESALDNLWEHSYQQFYTGTKEENGVIRYRVLMHDDGLGSSRLLFTEELKSDFPNGCRIAIPERSCALVIPEKQSRHLNTLDVIKNCYEGGRVKILNGIWSLSLFELEK